MSNRPNPMREIHGQRDRRALRAFDFAEFGKHPRKINEIRACILAGTPDNDDQMNALLRHPSNAKALRPAVTGEMILDRYPNEPITITGEFYQGTPGDIDDPDEITDVTATDKHGLTVDLTVDEVEEAAAKLLEVAR